MTTTRKMTKSPLALAREAPGVAREALPAYSSKYSRQDYTQPQLFALLALRRFLRVDYCGLEQHLEDWSERRQAVGLAKGPDHSTRHKAERRLLAQKGAPPCSTPPSRAPGRAGPSDLALG